MATSTRFIYILLCLMFALGLQLSTSNHSLANAEENFAIQNIKVTQTADVRAF